MLSPKQFQSASFPLAQAGEDMQLDAPYINGLGANFVRSSNGGDGEDEGSLMS